MTEPVGLVIIPSVIKN